MDSRTLQLHAVLQAGGQGQRIRGLAGDRPKPLLAVDGVPMIERLLRQLSAAGIRQVTVITGPRGEQIRQHLDGLADLPDDLRLGYYHEAEVRGNAGSLRFVSRDDAPLLLCFADLVTDLDFAELARIHETNDASVTLTSHWETHRLRLGEIQVVAQRVTDYREKPEKRFLICSGIGIFSAEVVRLVPRDRPSGLVDLVKLALANGHRVDHWTHGAFWMDVNSPEELELANRECANRH